MAAALTRAKKLDTSRKNSLSRLLDSIPQLLEDQGVSPERLVEARKSCKAAWEQFAAAHDALFEVRTEEEDPDEEEYGDLEARKEELSGTLAEAIVIRTRARDARELHQQKQVDEARAQEARQAEEARVRQEKQAELERVRQEKQDEQDRQHQVKLDEVAASRLRLASLHAQCKACLLYTSPSPRDRQKSRMPSSA